VLEGRCAGREEKERGKRVSGESGRRERGRGRGRDRKEGRGQVEGEVYGGRENEETVVDIFFLSVIHKKSKCSHAT